MRPLSKFALSVALAAALGLLFTSVPSGKKTVVTPQAAVESLKSESVSAKTAPVSVAPAAVPASRQVRPNAKTAGQKSPIQVAMPAIRGSVNYGWVALPHGTLVDLVRETGREMWVRWDGNLVKVDSSLVAKGALVVRSSGAAPRS